MKKIIIITILVSLLIGLTLVNLVVQEVTKKEQVKKITIDKQVWASPYKPQSHGCFVYSVVSFLESEKYRLTNRKIELSQMYIYYHVFIEKIQRYIGLRSYDTYSIGGQFDDALFITEKYGVVPLEDYVGLKNEKNLPPRDELFREIRDVFLKNTFEKAKNNELNIEWNNGEVKKPWLVDLKKILDSNIGEIPNEIIYDGKSYTPIKYSKDVLDLPLNDYIKLTSYSYIPFYKPGELLVKDNWLHKNDYYNLPIDEFIETIDNAINNNYSLVLDMHISMESYNEPVNYLDYKEDKVVSQDVRNELFDNWLTNDVHLVHLIGIAHDETGKKYYLIKDSIGKEHGFENPPIFLSENYVRARILAVMLHKDGIPQKFKKKMEIN